MSEQDNPTAPDDVDGHMPYQWRADAERNETDDDVAGQAPGSTDAEQDESDDDVAGQASGTADPGRDETGDDAHGHVTRFSG